MSDTREQRAENWLKLHCIINKRIDHWKLPATDESIALNHALLSETLAAFASSEAALARKQERETCAKDLCVRCRNGEGIYLHLDGKWRHKLAGSVCDAAAIHERNLAETGG